MNTPTPNFANAMMEQLAAHRATRAERSRTLWAMSAAEREAAMWRGELTNAQLWEWARRRPDEVPLINGEWAFIAALTPEVAEPTEATTPAKTTATAEKKK
jgi:hypothetical protein